MTTPTDRPVTAAAPTGGVLAYGYDINDQNDKSPRQTTPSVVYVVFVVTLSARHWGASVGAEKPVSISRFCQTGFVTKAGGSWLRDRPACRAEGEDSAAAPPNSTRGTAKNCQGSRVPIEVAFPNARVVGGSDYADRSPCRRQRRRCRRTKICRILLCGWEDNTERAAKSLHVGDLFARQNAEWAIRASAA